MAQMELTGKKRGKSREMAIKYIFADVDGTLGIGGIGIPEKNRLAIRKYVEEGGSFGVCTGRSPDSVKDFIGDLPINTLSVVNGGCALYDFQKGEYLDELCVEEDALQFAFSMKKELEQFTECRIVIVNRTNYWQVKTKEDQTACQQQNSYPIALLEQIEKPWYRIILCVSAQDGIKCAEFVRSHKPDGVRIEHTEDTLVEIMNEASGKGGCTQTCLQVSWRNCRGSRVYRRFF